MIMPSLLLQLWLSTLAALSGADRHDTGPSPLPAGRMPAIAVYAARRGPCPTYITITPAPAPSTIQRTVAVHIEYGEEVEGLCVSADVLDSTTFRFAVNGIDRTGFFTAGASSADAAAVPLEFGESPTSNVLVASIDVPSGVIRDTVTVTVYPGVRVTPLDGPDSLEGSADGSFRFLVENRTHASDTYTLACSATGPLACLGIDQGDTETVAAGTLDTITVTARAASDTGTASLRLDVAGTTAARAAMQVTVLPPPPVTGRFRILTPAHDQVDRAACPTVGAGAGSAVQCGDLLHAHAFPGYQSFGRARAPTMLYTSATATPLPMLTLEYDALPSDTAFGMLAVEVRAAATDSLLRRAYFSTATLSPVARGTYRLVVPVDHPSVRATGAHGVQVALFARDGGGWDWTSPLARVRTRLLVVNRAGSPFGKGWWLAGVERLHAGQDSGGVMLELPDGSALFYRDTGSGFAAPPGDYSTLVRLPGGGFRRTPAGLRVHVTYDEDGLPTEVATNDETPNVARYWWSTTVAGQLDSLTDAGGARLSLAYSAGDVRLGYPGVDSVGILFDSARTVTAIRDADHHLTHFAYAPGTARMTSSRTRATGTYRYTYDALGLVDSVLTPDEGATVPSAHRQFVSWLRAEAAALDGATEAAPAAPRAGMPTSHVIQERWVDGARLLDTTRIVVHRTGAVLSIRGPAGDTDTERDSLGRVVRVTLPAGGRVRQEYDSLGLLRRTIAEVDPSRVSRDTLVRHDTTHYDWDPAWRAVTRIRDPDGDVT